MEKKLNGNYDRPIITRDPTCAAVTARLLRFSSLLILLNELLIIHGTKSTCSTRTKKKFVSAATSLLPRRTCVYTYVRLGAPRRSNRPHVNLTNTFVRRLFAVRNNHSVYIIYRYMVYGIK